MLRAWINTTEFQVGATVRIRRDSIYACQSSAEGVIFDYGATGWVSVKFNCGMVNGYRIGLLEVDNGTCDLELAGPSVVPQKKIGSIYG